MSAMIDASRGACKRCGGKGYIEVHQSGYTHYETDALEPCPPYHYERMACSCNRIAVLERRLADAERERDNWKQANQTNIEIQKMFQQERDALRARQQKYDTLVTAAQLVLDKGILYTKALAAALRALKEQA